MKEVLKVLMVRDGLSRSEAVAEIKGFVNWLRANVESLSLCEIEEEFESLFGLEPDYIIDFLGLIG